jgi:hypothetical protein
VNGRSLSGPTESGPPGGRTSSTPSRRTWWSGAPAVASEHSSWATSTASVTVPTGATAATPTFTGGRSTASRQCWNTSRKNGASRWSRWTNTARPRPVRPVRPWTGASASSAGCTSASRVGWSPTRTVTARRTSERTYSRISPRTVAGIGITAGWHSQRCACSKIYGPSTPTSTGGRRTLRFQTRSGTPDVDGACAVCSWRLRRHAVHTGEDVIEGAASRSHRGSPLSRRPRGR